MKHLYILSYFFTTTTHRVQNMMHTLKRGPKINEFPNQTVLPEKRRQDKDKVRVCTSGEVERFIRNAVGRSKNCLKLMAIVTRAIF